MKMNSRKANLICILVAMIWGGGFIATDVGLQTFSPLTFLMIRFVGAGLIAWLPCLWMKKKEKLSWPLLWKGALSGSLLYVAFAFQTFGLVLTETGMNAFLTAVNVILVPYFAWMVFHTRPDKIIVAASVLCLAGIGCLSLSSGSFVFRFGDLLSLLCAVFFAAQIVALDLVKKENVLLLNAVQLSTAGLLSIPLALIQGGWPAVIPSQAWLSALYAICFATFLCYVLQTLAQKYTSPSAASVLLCTESLWANVFGFLFLHESKSWIMILGGAFDFCGYSAAGGKGFVFISETKADRPAGNGACRKLISCSVRENQMFGSDDAGYESRIVMVSSSLIKRALCGGVRKSGVLTVQVFFQAL